RQSESFRHSCLPYLPCLAIDPITLPEVVLLGTQIQVSTNCVLDLVAFRSAKILKPKSSTRSTRLTWQPPYDLRIPTRVLRKGLEPKLIAESTQRIEDRRAGNHNANYACTRYDFVE